MPEITYKEDGAFTPCQKDATGGKSKQPWCGEHQVLANITATICLPAFLFPITRHNTNCFTFQTPQRPYLEDACEAGCLRRQVNSFKDDANF